MAATPNSPEQVMPSAETKFDLRRLYFVVSIRREQMGMSWAALSRQVGVAPSTIKRFESAEDAEADGVLALVRWLGVPPEDFINGPTGNGTTLPEAGEGFVRVDMKLVAAANDEPAGARGRTRTTIQRLVHAAAQAQQPIAALTRIAAT